MLKKPLAALAGLAAILLGSAVFAQDQNTTVKAKHGAWEIRCSAQQADACAMVQTGNNAEGQPVLRVLLKKTPGLQSPQGQPVAAVLEVIAPIGVLLPPGILIKIDGRELGRAGFQVCNPQACLVAEPVQEDFVSQMKKGNSATMTLTGPNGQSTDIAISLSGFTKAYNGL